MEKIDTNNWKEFRIGDLFLSEKNGDLKSVQQLSDGNVAVVSSSMQNQGIIGYYDTDAPYKNQLTMAHIGAGAGFCSYHNYSFNVTCNAGVLSCKYELNKYTGNYLASIISRHCTQRYDYKNVVTESKLFAELIKLPVSSDGQPDWKYMEDYMKAIEKEAEKKLSLIDVDKEKEELDTKNWKEFRVGDLFELSLSKDDIQPKKIVEGDIPLVSSGKTNNGVVAFIQDDKATLQKPNTITVDMFGKAFYQSAPYYCVSHGRVNILKPKFDMTKYTGLFISSVIESVSAPKYEFKNMCTGTRLAEDVIKLPATSNGTPDWDYMERYMREIEQKADKKLTEQIRQIEIAQAV